MTSIAIVGGGPVGAYMALLLARRGFSVDLFERRPDPRKAAYKGGRSINLALSRRGLFALDRMSIASKVLSHAVPMRGRLMHSRDGAGSFQPYGRDASFFINSVNRSSLAMELLALCAEDKKISLHFERTLKSVSLAKTSVLEFEDGEKRSFDFVFGCDGSASKLRDAVQAFTGGTFEIFECGYSYKELHIPPINGDFAFEPQALHIWPRGSWMLIALPNDDFSFTATLFLPTEGALSFASLQNKEEARRVFDEELQDVVNVISNFSEQWTANPVGHLPTVKGRPWSADQRACLLGDAAHAIVPFFGQGLNCGFEDCVVFEEILDEQALDLPSAIQIFSERRPDDADAISRMAHENFIEMRDLVADQRFLFEKQIESELMRRFDSIYWSRYALVTFSRLPYSQAEDIGRRQQKFLSVLSEQYHSIEEINWKTVENKIYDELVPFFNPKKELMGWT